MDQLKVIFTEGSLHHLCDRYMRAVPRRGDEVVIDNDLWIVERVTHLPFNPSTGKNDNEDCMGWDEDRQADLSVHLRERS
jgi:hypothetical protein